MLNLAIVNPNSWLISQNSQENSALMPRPHFVRKYLEDLNFHLDRPF